MTFILSKVRGASFERTNCVARGQARMEKLRRKRINTSLEQLRTLLPYSVNMKKDMASLLEQTVEYINIMHTVLNEDKPACLNKVYLAYRQKTDEIESFHKTFKKSMPKRMKTDLGCSWSQPCHHSYPGPIIPDIDIDPYLKHSCSTSSYYDQAPSRINAWQPPQRVSDSFLQNQPCFSGQNQNQFLSIQHHSMNPRAPYYTTCNIPTKQLEVGTLLESTPGSSSYTEQQETGKTNIVAKINPWQSANSFTLQKEMPFYDENNNSTDCCEGPATNSPHSDLKEEKNSQAAVAISSVTQIPAITTKYDESTSIQNATCDITNVALATGILKSQPSPKTDAHGSPEIYFTGGHSCSASANPYPAISSWMTSCPLPSMSLNQNFQVVTSHPPTSCEAIATSENTSSTFTFTHNTDLSVVSHDGK
ncbi:unnamed protein product [Clavelina lepadiformis]|uniref:BHLH domain-containing protein n=2 Tax=Clavelina lepadiformis TaxID=159417 RepID=A0ABP0F1Y7_CLALP